jgi:hypothetical protein
MPANWSSFITNVSNKLSGQSIQGPYDPAGKDVDDFATYLADQYVLAVNNKAQTPFGNLHRKGNSELLKTAFSKAFKLLESEKSPTLEKKLKDPKYEDLKEPIPLIDIEEYLDKFDLEFLAWAELNGASIPDFTYSIFFSQFPNFPKTRSGQVLEIARRIVQKYDGTSDYIQWLYVIGFDPSYSDWTKEVVDKSIEIIKSIGTSSDKKIGDFKNLRNINISKELFQEEHINDPQRIPNYMVMDFITKFTYDKRYDSGLFKKLKILSSDYYTVEEINSGDEYYDTDDEIDANIDEAFKVSNILTNANLDNLFGGEIDAFGVGQLDYLVKGLSTGSELYSEIVNTSDGISESKAIEYKAEAERFLELKRRYIQELIDAAIADADRSSVEDEANPNDPYNIMAKGISDYWVSTILQPFTTTPPVPPCVIPPPLGGFYTPIYYGSRKRLADYLRRAFNTGKIFKTIPERRISAIAVSSALAFSFAANMLEFKLIYNGGVPTPGGPAPMVGFVPVVF